MLLEIERQLGVGNREDDSLHAALANVLRNRVQRRVGHVALAQCRLATASEWNAHDLGIRRRLDSGVGKARAALAGRETNRHPRRPPLAPPHP
jgi:hypothetical protein